MLKKQQLLEEKLANETNSRRKIRPSVKVKKAVHDVYIALVQNEQKWDTTKPFGHPVNRDVNEEIKKAVKSQLNDDDEAVIQVAMRTYFFTKRKENKRETSGKAATFRVKQARRQRKQQVMRQFIFLIGISNMDSKYKG
ncbi:uncharacterized protein [Ptychodera flava]|uniref:uncharacterized protein n=1 Tax=Ptychodera flava TaxID=63121 RepID=UPI00396A8CC1